MIRIPSRTICHFYDLEILVYNTVITIVLTQSLYQDMETLLLKLLVIWKMSHNDIDKQNF